jgi:hypothetical protein
MEERFEVLSSRPSFLAGRKWQTARPGRSVVFRPRAAPLSNRGDEVAHVVCHARPPGRRCSTIEDVAALARAGKLTRHGLSKTPSALLQAAVMTQQHKETRARPLTR